MEEGVTGAADAATGRIGERLAAARLAGGFSLDDIAAGTRIPRRHLETIEADGTDGLPAIPYTLGFVRSFARMVGIDPESAATAYRAHLNAAPATRIVAPEPYEPADPARVPPRWLAVLALVLAAAIAIGYGLWRSGHRDDARVAATASDAAPATTTATPVAPARPTAGIVTLTATAPVWVSISEKNGPKLFEREMAPGQSFAVPAAAVDPRLRTGRPQMLAITVDGVAVAPVGQPDRLLSDQSLKPAALLGRAATPGAAPDPGGLVPQVIAPLVPQRGDTVPRGSGA